MISIKVDRPYNEMPTTKPFLTLQAKFPLLTDAGAARRNVQISGPDGIWSTWMVTQNGRNLDFWKNSEAIAQFKSLAKKRAKAEAKAENDSFKEQINAGYSSDAFKTGVKSAFSFGNIFGGLLVVGLVVFGFKYFNK